MGQKKSRPKETVEAKPDEQPEQKASPPESGTTTAEVPSEKPSGTATDQPPSDEPSGTATDQPPSDEPSGTTTDQTPSDEPTGTATDQTPSDEPSGTATDQTPSDEPSGTATDQTPSDEPSGTATDQPPSDEPSGTATDQTPSDEPSGTATDQTPSDEPTGTATDQSPSDEPTGTATDQTPSDEPTGTATDQTPSDEPSGTATDQPPSDEPSGTATDQPPSGTITVQPPSDEPMREQSREKSVSPPPPKQLEHLQIESSHLHRGSTESIIGVIHPDRLDPAEHKDPVKFKDIQPTIRTGDLALLYRHDQPFPHLAIFINHIETDPLFPLLLVKGKTKPLSLSKFDPDKPRFIHPVTATTRIFYGDYEKVAIQYVKGEGSDVEIDAVVAMNAVHEVEKIQFSEKEREVIKSAVNDQDRSLYMSTFMAAYYYKALGIFKGNPEDVTPENFRDQLPLMDPISVFLPPVKVGPMRRGDPPFLKQLVEGIRPPHAKTFVPYDEAIKDLDTGDLVLFAGATSQGAIIRFFDHSQFSHVGLVLKEKFTSQLLLWEASTNHGRLVDLQEGTPLTGVEVIPLRSKVFSGWYDHVAIRRLLNITKERREEIYNTMLRLRKEWAGKKYEKNLIQLCLSAINPNNKFLSIFQNTHEDLSTIFCSELVAAAYQRMGIIKKDHPSHTYTPDDFSSERASDFLCEGVEFSDEIHIELMWPEDKEPSKTELNKQTSQY